MYILNLRWVQFTMVIDRRSYGWKLTAQNRHSRRADSFLVASALVNNHGKLNSPQCWVQYKSNYCLFKSEYRYEFLGQIPEEGFVGNDLWPRYKSKYSTELYILGTLVLYQWHLYFSIGLISVLAWTILQSKVRERTRGKIGSKRTSERWLFLPAGFELRF